MSAAWDRACHAQNLRTTQLYRALQARPPRRTEPSRYEPYRYEPSTRLKPKPKEAEGGEAIVLASLLIPLLAILAFLITQI